MSKFITLFTIKNTISCKKRNTMSKGWKNMSLGNGHPTSKSQICIDNLKDIVLQFRNPSWQVRLEGHFCMLSWLGGFMVIPDVCRQQVRCLPFSEGSQVLYRNLLASLDSLFSIKRWESCYRQDRFLNWSSHDHALTFISCLGQSKVLIYLLIIMINFLM